MADSYLSRQPLTAQSAFYTLLCPVPNRQRHDAVWRLSGTSGRLISRE